MKHLIDLKDFSDLSIKKIIDLAIVIKNDPKKFYGVCEGKILATLFFEPSTRTQMSFQTAMLRLGGRIIGFDNPSNSSVSKGENLKDTIKVISGYSDILAIRHPLEGSAAVSSIFSSCPVINAGDGGHLHPTQTLTDLVTLKSEKGRIDNLKIGIVGDLKNGRTVHSLITTLCQYQGNEFILISTPELSVPSYILDILNANGVKYKIVNNLENAISTLDVLYVTRIQKERFVNEEEYLTQKNVFVLDKAKLSLAKNDLIIMHPLPKVDEIALEVDDDPRAIYFKQAEYGVYARMALIICLLDNESPLQIRPLDIKCDNLLKNVKCSNPNCITNTETYLQKSYTKNSDLLSCDYCNHLTLL